MNAINTIQRDLKVRIALVSAAIGVVVTATAFLWIYIATTLPTLI